jgi:3-dehydroquinate synthase
MKALRSAANLESDFLVLPDGEAHKDIPTLMMVIDHALQTKVDRKGTFVALGGGVVGDMVGFAAAIYQRGIDFVQV